MLWSDWLDRRSDWRVKAANDALDALYESQTRRWPSRNSTQTFDGMAREIGRLNDYIATLESELRQLHAELEQS